MLITSITICCIFVQSNFSLFISKGISQFLDQQKETFREYQSESEF